MISLAEQKSKKKKNRWTDGLLRILTRRAPYGVINSYLVIGEPTCETYARIPCYHCLYKKQSTADIIRGTMLNLSFILAKINTINMMQHLYWVAVECCGCYQWPRKNNKQSILPHYSDCLISHS